MRRWMYVSVAVDCYTYDLLHIAIYRHRNKASSHAFLLALRAKGYRPRVIVTDLWPEYDSLLAEVFPGTRPSLLYLSCLASGSKTHQEGLRPRLQGNPPPGRGP